MRKFKANLTIQQHEQLGLQIRPFKDLMCHVVVELSNRYGKTSRQAKLADVVWRKLGDLKSALEDCAFNDHPGEVNLTNELNECERRRSELVLNKKQHEVKMLAIKNLVRGGGTMPYAKYRQCIDSQQTHANSILKIEQTLSPLKARMAELKAQIDEQQRNGQPHAPQQSASDLVKMLVSVRQEYQDFAADRTRVASMRQMAAEFVLKINPIVRAALGESAKAEATQ